MKFFYFFYSENYLKVKLSLFSLNTLVKPFKSTQMRKLSTLAFSLFLTTILTAQVYKLESPDKQISVTVELSDKTHYSVSFQNEMIVKPSQVSMVINGIELGNNARVQKVNRKSVSGTIKPVVPRKYAEIKEEYNEMTLVYRGDYSLTFRIYNDGMAYRWETKIKNKVKVNSEQANFVFADDYKIWFPEEASMHSGQERVYKYISLSDIKGDMFCSTGTLVDLGNGKKAYLSEAELYDYPGMFLKGMDQFGLQGKYAGYPKETERINYRETKVTAYEDFLALTDGTRSYPWRVILLTDNDTELVESEIIFKLSNPLAIDDYSWIKPGKVAWDWWNDWNIYGVDFRAGINTDTYKYYIDFASEYGLEYILLDEGWYTDEDVFKLVPEVNLKEIVRYANEKSVGVILWVTWRALDEQLDKAMDAFEEWGIKGVKIDFMNRDDQWMVNYYYKIAREAAKHKLLVDFHGAYKPTGFSRAYPNVITTEGVRGLEFNKWSSLPDPDHNLILPFIRMVAGAMDYTPGAMLNVTRDNFLATRKQPMSLGTRCHQLAMYVVYESPLQMLSDNPSNYYKNPEAMEFLKAVPTVWEDTKVLHGKVGEYITIARKSGDNWFVGSMTNWSPRSLQLSLDFLGEGNYEIEIWQDGINADRHAADFKQVKQSVKKDSELTINMAPGGGWAAIITKK
jgi:alpha-glucosidase